MSKAHYFYFRLPLKELEERVKIHQEEFEKLLGDTFSEVELEVHEPKLDGIAALFVQPIFTEMSFDDLFAKEGEEERQKEFFEACRSSICLDNIPDLHTNPFQVTYLIELLRDFDEVLIDTGGVNELMFKPQYVQDLKRYKNIFSLLKEETAKPLEVKTSKPVDPIDFLILAVYQELERVDPAVAAEQVKTLPEKTQKAYQALRGEKLDASALLRKSGLGAKDFDDNLERLKFFLRKLP